MGILVVQPSPSSPLLRPTNPLLPLPSQGLQHHLVASHQYLTFDFLGGDMAAAALSPAPLIGADGSNVVGVVLVSVGRCQPHTPDRGGWVQCLIGADGSNVMGVVLVSVGRGSVYDHRAFDRVGL